MPVELKLGLVGLDTSHCVAFAKLLNDPAAADHVPGGRVVAGFPGGSDDFELSRSRVTKFTEELRDQFGVTILESPEAVAEQVDAVLITSADGRVHLEQFRKIAPFGKPTFIDKPLAVTTADAKAIIELAMEQGVPMMSSSSLRFA
ncbi:MAG TPA: Gfo/Idh/MocA family oxidoreductase, partial [Armatimonadota bacterium]|nr:Gfo/Idh/MocA family oxidoreductase [Armatimonadota bacterium]